MNLKKIKKLSERLKYIRLQLNLSQVELAEMAGTTQQAIQQAEAGKARQPRYLHKLSQVLEIPIDWLILGEVDEAVPQNQKHAHGLQEQSSDILQKFYAMPTEDQKLIFELMKSRQKNKS